MASCPVGAIEKTADGRVTIDHDACIQCRNCYFACPYGMIQISETLNKPVKCDLCHDKIEAGVYKEPVCVSNCALQALYFGLLEDLQEERDKKIAAEVLDRGHLVSEIMGYKEA